MSTFVLIPGADGRALYWRYLVPELRQRGHDAVAVGLPLEGSNGLAEYASAVVDAVADRNDLVVVAQSLGALTGPLVCGRLPVRHLVLLNPMVPAPGETANDWWGNTGQEEARVRAATEEGRPTEFEIVRDFFHDVPEDVTAAMVADDSPAADLATVFGDPWPLTAWPDVSTRFLQGRDDRFFPLAFQRRVVAQRLPGVEVEELPGGHCLALSRPVELAEALGSGP